MAPLSELDRLRAVYRDYGAQDLAGSRWSAANAGNQAIAAERTRALGRLLARFGYLPLAHRRVLEIGCGTGEVLATLVTLGAAPAQLHGVDMRDDALTGARTSVPAAALAVADAAHLAYADACFDLVVASTVFTSVLDATMARSMAGEIARVLRPGGALVWYDFRFDNPRNPHVRGLGRRAIRALFPGFTTYLETLTLLPPLARRLGRTTPWLYPVLVSLPWLRTHHLGLLRKLS